jgi:hypothetical protein
MYTYAFLALSPAPLDLPSGIAGKLDLFDVEGLAALVEPNLNVEDLQEDDQRLMRAILDHDRILRDIFSQTALLPLQFGTYFRSPENLRDHLTAHATAYREKLTNLQGKAEYTLKLTAIPYPEAAIALDVKGKEYFLAKKRLFEAQQQWQRQQSHELEQLVSLIAQDYDLVQGDPTEDLERLYLLCDRAQESLLIARLGQWRSQISAWQMTIGESLPPYHFV